jgi:hypothetical protein
MYRPHPRSPTRRESGTLAHLRDSGRGGRRKSAKLPTASPDWKPNCATHLKTQSFTEMSATIFDPLFSSSLGASAITHGLLRRD